MTKKGPLSKVEVFFVKNNYKEMDVETLCKEMDRTKGVVEKCVAQCKGEEPKTRDITDQFGQSRGSTVMTPNASEIIDSMRGQADTSARQQGCTTNIK